MHRIVLRHGAWRAVSRTIVGTPVRRNFSSLVTHETSKQPVGKGAQVAQQLGSRSTSFANPEGTKRGGVDGLTIVLSLLVTAAVGGTAYVTLTEQGKELLRSSNIPGVSFVYENLVKPFADPIRDKLLPDFPPLQPGEVMPKTLVLDFEDTLVHLEWNREYGWRAVKRPGVDQFLSRVSAANYEVVLFCLGLAMFLEPFTVSIDPRGAIQYRLFRESTQFVGNKFVKDLSKLNRDLANVIDDDAGAVEYQPENLVVIKPFVDKTDLTDHALLDLAAMLEDFQLRDVQDVRVELARLRGKGMGDTLAGFRLDREERLKKAEEAQQRGLGGLIRGLGRHQHPQPVAGFPTPK